MFASATQGGHKNHYVAYMCKKNYSLYTVYTHS